MAAPSTVDVSNSHLTVKSDRPVRPVEAGIDTWRGLRHLDSDAELRQACDLCPGGLHPQPVAGHRVGVIPGLRMLWFEGHPEVDGLGSPDKLHERETALLDTLADAGFPVGADRGLSRLDQTVTLEFAEPDAGLALLVGLSVVDVPRLKPGTEGRPIETVHWRGRGKSKRIRARAYDKGIESGSAERGRFIRLENQTRYTKEARMSARTHADQPRIASTQFHHRFAPVAESVDGLHAATVPVIADRLVDLSRRGVITWAAAERLAGYLLLQDKLKQSPSTQRRRRRELREHGLVLVDPLEDPIDVDMGEALDAALAAWATDG